jgi:hypothetical protein
MELDDAASTSPHTFLSYSRKDQAFVAWLAEALTTRGFVVDWDQASTDPDNISTGISAEDEWWDRLQQMIAAADVVVFVVSPDAAASQVCDEEIAYARGIGKRTIAILCRPVDFHRVPPRLSALNVKISFVDETDGPLEDLVRALSVDVGWMREATWITQEAMRWQAAARAGELLLLGPDLRRAETWLLHRRAGSPEPTELVVDFIAESRRFESERRAVEDLQRVRFQAIDNVTHDLLEEELRVRQSWPRSKHPGVADEQRTEIAKLRSLVERVDRWHPQPARHLGSGGAVDGYPEYFEFPCCGLGIKDFLATGDQDPPTQLRRDGCLEIPTSTRYEPPRRSNPFHSLLVHRYRELEAEHREQHPSTEQ